MSLNPKDLALEKKEKAKPKALASCVAENEKFLCLRTTLSPTDNETPPNTYVTLVTFFLPN